ncbi:norm2 [Bifidobacterium bifidum]|nr:norm2 [Bifidobacterium bifidum]
MTSHLGYAPGDRESKAGGGHANSRNGSYPKTPSTPVGEAAVQVPATGRLVHPEVGAQASESQILYDRSPKERVAKVAPYLTLDGRVYPAVVDGRVKWVVDGYTTSDAYPYSQMTDLGNATKDSTTVSSSTVSSLGSQQANYIRNSVKATVDAYDGSVDLYVWDQSDPVIKAWEKIFPGQYHQLSESPVT